MIISIFGQPGSGKTTLSNLFRHARPGYFQIDGDELRKITPNPGYTQDGRVQNITNANTIATYLNHEDEDAVMSLVNPFRYLRADLRHRNPEQVFSVYLTSDRDTKREFHYADFEYPKMDELVFHTDTTHSTPKETFVEVVDKFLSWKIAKLQS